MLKHIRKKYKTASQVFLFFFCADRIYIRQIFSIMMTMQFDTFPKLRQVFYIILMTKLFFRPHEPRLVVKKDNKTTTPLHSKRRKKRQ